MPDFRLRIIYTFIHRLCVNLMHSAGGTIARTDRA
jgi:hypothetical protein